VLLQDWVTHQAKTRPDALAVVAGSDRITYGALEARSNQLARALAEAGCRQGDRVAVLMPKSPMAIVAILGIHKADCIFVPLDRSSPTARTAKTLESSASRCLLAAGRVLDLLDQLCTESVLHEMPAIGWLGDGRPAGSCFRVRFTRHEVEACPDARVESRNGPDAAAHILFTPGSTGAPKGIVISHASVIQFVEWACAYFGIDATDRLSGHSPLHVDLSTFDIFGTFAAGAQLHLVPPKLTTRPHRLAEFIRSCELTQWLSVPSVLNDLAKLDVLGPHDCPALKRVLWSGDVLPTPSLIYWMQRLPHVTFTNLYGPAETTIASAYFTVSECPSDPFAGVPIGTACSGEELMVLNEQLQPLPPDHIGELYIRGAGVSSGYWCDPERTAAAFVRNPYGSDPADRLYRTGDLARIGLNGLAYFVGRIDSRIRSRGYRIEPGEIEASLCTIREVHEAAVVGIPTSGFEGTLIACAYVPLHDHAVSPADLRQALSALVPPYMLPSRWMTLPSLPKNASGKIDRRALHELFTNREAVVA
jgi:amino acid adenylation domain-containing protein